MCIYIAMNRLMRLSTIQCKSLQKRKILTHCPKALTADYRRLDVQLLKRRGLIYLVGEADDTSGRSKFAHISDGHIGTTGFELSLRIYPNHICVTDGYDGSISAPNRTVIALERTPCNFGGARVWFRCPNAKCGRRVAVLYLADEIKCRKCARLRYESQFDSRLRRTLRKCRIIRWRLGGSANLLEPFPQRPKGMPSARYQSLWARAVQAETFYFEAIGSGARS
jgi:hypothetical protein